MTPGPVDLHIHSDRSSDGDLPPLEIVRLAAEHGFSAISIADHDNVAAYPEAIESARGTGVEVVPSMEVTTLYGEREFHCLLPFLDWAGPVVGRIAERVTKGRWLEARERVEKLIGLGLDLTWAEVEAASAGAAPLGVTIARILLRKPSARRDPKLAKYYDRTGRPLAPSEFYKDHFLEGRPAFVPKRHMPLLEVLALAPEAGAVTVLSHPGAYFQNTTREDLVDLKARGLVGLEVFTTYHDEAQTGRYAGIAAELDLVATAGSDFHGGVKPHVPFGAVRAGGPAMVEALRERRP